ncbi:MULTISPECIES: NAD(P)H-dependent oxidoreductase [unclassified Staphylococcus]|uniref:NAD(P)H-dependent oxidoreductase n=1 Tax=unclassified Staphylococcus TaxID=91994 RepID=UPI0021CF56A1|nr:MULTISPECIES: NAD(P)H-dependent oxidoreductase [unclassified Staphylococcus]UXR77538.1 NAD(P)H-dependent oxidoreductase [Staphylococcus sp. IVB6227]UXR83320.1 NAD(P)H-dependent oxidoreductase [Staphylococcus sp. IVB6214]
MKTTIFLFHPNINVSRVNRALSTAAEKAGIEVRNLYDLYPDWKIDVKKEQEVLKDVDRIVFQFPMYWYSTPSLMKEWFDQVLEYGWAYGSEGNALQGKKVILAVSQGSPAESYTKSGRVEATTEELLKPIFTIKYLTGLEFEAPFVVAGTSNLADDDLEKASKEYVKRLNELS